MDKMRKHPNGNWITPLPFRTPRPKLPNNKSHAIKRPNVMHHALKRDPIKREHFVKFMFGLISKDHAKIVLPVHESQEC